MTITLAQLEQEVARRIGPFKVLVADPSTPTISTTTFGVVPYLQTSLELDEVSNLFALRRGIRADGQVVTLNPLDRQRRVRSVDASKGTFEADRPWQDPLDPLEVIEFHHLDPEQELRPVILAGLRRCIVEDRFQIGPGYIYECDLTAVVPWLTDTNQVRDVQVGPYPSSWPGWWGGPRALPFEVFDECGHVWLRVSGAGDIAPFYGGLYVTALHNHGDIVNSCGGGPAAQDGDVLQCDVDWAAAMCHAEAWHLMPARLQAAAGAGWQATREQAAAEATRQAWVHRPPRRDRWSFSRTELWSMGGGMNDGARRPTVVNS